MTTPPRQPTPEDIDKLVALLRRALTRLNTVEARVAAIEERLHALEDLPETIQGLERLTRRVHESERMDKQRVRDIAVAAAEQYLKQHGV